MVFHQQSILSIIYRTKINGVIAAQPDAGAKNRLSNGINATAI
jgi:hypothetical protein